MSELPVQSYLGITVMFLLIFAFLYTQLFIWMECKEKLKIMIEIEQVLMEEVKIFC